MIIRQIKFYPPRLPSDYISLNKAYFLAIICKFAYTDPRTFLFFYKYLQK